jgi:hypothetical protein
MNRPSRIGAAGTNSNSKYGASKGLPSVGRYQQRYSYTVGYDEPEETGNNNQYAHQNYASTPQPVVASQDQHRKNYFDDDHHVDEVQSRSFSTTTSKIPPGRLRPSGSNNNNNNRGDEDNDEQEGNSTITPNVSVIDTNSTTSPSRLNHRSVLQNNSSSSQHTGGKTRVPLGLPPLGLSAERAERLSARNATNSNSNLPTPTGSKNLLPSYANISTTANVKPTADID